MDDLSGFLRIPKKLKPNLSERGELLSYFLETINSSRADYNKTRFTKQLRPMTFPRLAFLLTGIETKDLYALKSKMEDAERRGKSASAIFWLETKGQ